MSRKAKAQPRPDLLEAAFALIAEKGWHGFSALALAERTGASLDDIHDLLPTPAALVGRLGERLDRAMLAAPPDELLELSPRERLFELLMRRLDALAPFKPGLARLRVEARAEVELALATLASLDRMAAWLLDLAGLPGRGLRGRLARRALMLAYGRVLAVWLADDTPDQDDTLAELDKRLDQLERLARLGDRLTAGLGPRPRAA
ncbi:MAG: hypothetical protein H6852_15730 [Geminicoccaceae bacterium]|nr:hypothetical protein [Geminicoccaceae bacterium]MCB9969068.1 hypothetical protein [Geminicoccaceae bacterium]HRY23677.1 hypothetical protein [Geminicoccaceae bacterium]